MFYNQTLCSDMVNAFISGMDSKPDAIVGIESRGFLLGFLMANQLNIPFVLVRKAGKLPYKTISYEYDLEYGKSKIEMHEDALKSGWKVIIHDDLLATAVHCIRKASLPVLASVKPQAPIHSAEANLGKYFFFCSSFPNCKI